MDGNVAFIDTGVSRVSESFFGKSLRPVAGPEVNPYIKLRVRVSKEWQITFISIR